MEEESEADHTIANISLHSYHDVKLSLRCVLRGLVQANQELKLFLWMKYMLCVDARWLYLPRLKK